MPATKGSARTPLGPRLNVQWYWALLNIKQAGFLHGQYINKYLPGPVWHTLLKLMVQFLRHCFSWMIFLLTPIFFQFFLFTVNWTRLLFWLIWCSVKFGSVKLWHQKKSLLLWWWISALALTKLNNYINHFKSNRIILNHIKSYYIKLYRTIISL